jgi:hypothetical protein
MTTFTAFSTDQLNSLKDKLKGLLAPCTLYEQAAQTFSETLYHEFSPSVVLARVYASIPFSQLPPANKTFVTDLATSKNVGNLINDKTPILSLAGTAGKKPTWMDRRKSQGHVGIPLCSASFVDAIPMMSRLLQELGFSLAWFDKQDLSLIEKSAGGMSGLFYVAQAGEDTDAKGRKIIPAQDFVAAQNVRTVFGMGTTYVRGTFAVSIIFTNETIGKAQLKPLLTLISTFKSETSRLTSPDTWMAA